MIFRDSAPIRDGFGRALVEVATRRREVVALTADVSEPTRVHWFAEEFPNRFYQMGISENDMIGTAAGMALNGLIPFATTFAVFAASLAHQAIRLSVAYNEANVKIVCSHGGITVGGDGATHQAFEDLALMRLIPGMTVVCPCDANEAYDATIAIADYEGPVYMRVGRIASPIIDQGRSSFELGKARIVRTGDDVALLANGIMLVYALEAAELLEQEGVQARVINLHTLKPLDEDAVLSAARECAALVTVEEHSVLGGLRGAVAELLSARHPTPIEGVGVNDTFGEAGEPEEMLAKYGLTVNQILAAARRAVSRGGVVTEV